MERLDEICARKYPVRMHWIDEGDGDGYVFAYLPDFGHSTVSATADTEKEALDELAIMKRDIIQYFLETGKKIPEPSEAPFEGKQLQQMPIRITKDLHSRLVTNAAQNGQSLNSYVTTVLTEYTTLELVVKRAVEIIARAQEISWYTRAGKQNPSTNSSTIDVSEGTTKRSHLSIVKNMDSEQSSLYKCSGWEA